MYRLGILVIALVSVLAGCRGDFGRNAPPTTLPGIDFNYDATWKAAAEAVQMHFPDLQHCLKESRKIVSYFKRQMDRDAALPYEYARRVFLEIVPRKGPDGRAVHNIQVRVEKYIRRRNPFRDSDEGWDFLKRDWELERKILKSFGEMTALDQRMRQGHQKFEKRRGRDW